MEIVVYDEYGTLPDDFYEKVDEMKNNNNKILRRMILFRGKVSEDDELGYKKGEWVKGSLFIDVIEGETYIFDCRNGKVKVDSDTVGQYVTTDYYGEQIFEGDILLIDDEYYGIVEYENECCGFLVRSFSLTESLESLSNIELCGNKWDTKYLMKRIEE